MIGYASVFTFGSYLVELWCSWKIYKFLNFLPIDPRSKIKETQITRTLIAQAIFPLLTFTMPMGFLIVNVTAPIDINVNYSFFIGFIFAYYPTLNAFSALLFIKQYRRKISQSAKRYCNKVFPNICSITTEERS